MLASGGIILNNTSKNNRITPPKPTRLYMSNLLII